MKSKQTEKLKLLISLTRINNPKVLKALHLYFIDGLNQHQATVIAGVSSDSVTSNAIKSINESMITVDELAMYKHVKFSNIKEDQPNKDKQ